MSELPAKSATHLRAMLGRREISARELTLATLACIDAINPAINAVVARNDGAALAAADASDARLARGEDRPLEGLPITLKDAWEVAGLVSTGGFPDLAGFVPGEDAVPVARLRAAGAVILGKSNVPLLSGDFQTYNAIYGETCNPWDHACTPGGSSGGAAAAVATGMSAFELGSDIGGSIRWPASACGVFGLKTTWDLVPLYGHTPPTRAMRTKAPMDLGVAGPIGRSAADLDLVLSVVAGPMNAAGPAFLKKPRTRDVKNLRLAVWLDPFALVDTRVERAVRTAADLLARDGAAIDENARPGFSFAEAFEVYSLLLHAITLAGFPARVREKIAARASDFPPGDLSHAGLQARAARIGAEMFSDLQKRRRKIRDDLATFFETYDAILCPVTPAPFVKHDFLPDSLARKIEMDIGQMPYFDLVKWASIATLANCPAVSAPVLRTAENMPVGVQIICAEGEDRTATAIAAMIERATGGFVPPPLV